jgi:carbonic anhydrase/acetyltransferase-like protein (isoleucine patch superfamily)
MSTEPPAGIPLILPFDDVMPRLAEGVRFLGPGASVLGKVELGARTAIAGGAAIRADGHFVRIGEDCFFGEASTVHIAQDLYPAIIGDRVTVGRAAVVHACTVGDDCVIEDDAVILDGSVVEDGVLIEAGSTVFPKTKLGGGFAYAGTPAKPVRAVTPAEREARAGVLRQAFAALEFGRRRRDAVVSAPSTVFIAKTAQLSGTVELQDRASVFFGCDFDAGEFRIRIGARTNIQDNTFIRCKAGDTAIGCDTTLGHNVRLSSCRIGDHALIGIGAVVALGVVVEDFTMLAAGAVTQPGQTLESGWLWGGRPARALSRLDDAKRGLMQTITGHYCGYAEAYARAQAGV